MTKKPKKAIVARSPRTGRKRKTPKRPKQKATKATELEMEARIQCAIAAIADRQNPRAALYHEWNLTNPRTISVIVCEAKKRYAAIGKEDLPKKKASLLERIRNDARLCSPSARASLRKLEAEIEGLIVSKSEARLDVAAPILSTDLQRALIEVDAPCFADDLPPSPVE